MTITQSNQICEECENAIAPVCIGCYNKNLLSWLKQNIGNNGLIHIIFMKAMGNIELSDFEVNTCMSCHEKNILICKHCYVASIGRALQEMNMPNKNVWNFKEIFN